MFRLMTACFFLLATVAVAEASDVPAGSVSIPRAEYFDFTSASNRRYRIFVARPSGDAPESGYPVIFINDANTQFVTFVEAVRLFERRRDTLRQATALVVGIGYPDDVDPLKERMFDLTPPAADYEETIRAGGAPALLDFIDDELKPWLARKYATDSEKQSIFGHSFGGLFGLYALLTSPDSFDNYLLASPSIWWHERVILDLETEFARSRTPADPQLLVSITVGEFEEALNPEADYGGQSDEVLAMLLSRGQVSQSRGLAGRLQELPSLDVRHAVIAGEDHGSVVPAAITRQLGILFRSH